MVFVGIFLLNNNREDVRNEMILNAILTVFSICFLMGSFLLFATNRIKLKKIDVVLLFCLIFCAIMTLFVRKYFSVHWIYLLTAICVSKLDLCLNRRYFDIFMLVGFFSIIWQLSTIKNFFGIPVLSWQDPNYSSLVIFLFGLFLFKLGKNYLTYIALFLGLFTLSRACFIAISIFILLRIPFIHKLLMQSIFHSVPFYFFIVIAVPYIATVPYLNYLEKNSDKMNNDIMTRDINRLSSYWDASNQDRFIANELFIEDLVNHPQRYLFGIHLEEYTKTIFRNSPHNIVGQLVLNYGIFFAIFYLILLFRMIKLLFSGDNEFILYPLLIYLLFLGGVWIGISLIFFTILLKLNFRNDKA
jgi:hypothetical protein